MEQIAFRLAVTLLVLVWELALFIAAGNSSLGKRDPALRFIRIIMVPEVLYTAVEAVFLICSISGYESFRGLITISLLIRMIIPMCYIMFFYRHLIANGQNYSGIISLKVLIAITIANYVVFLLQFPFSTLSSLIWTINEIILGLTLLYTTLSFVGANIKQTSFLPSTKAALWIAVFLLAYFPFVGISDTFKLSVSFLNPDRPLSLQLFPFREIIILILVMLFLEPFHSHFRGKNPEPMKALSPRELEIAALLREGASNNMIAEKLFISVPTVKTHVRNVLRKYRVSAREELSQILSDHEAP